MTGLAPGSHARAGWSRSRRLARTPGGAVRVAARPGALPSPAGWRTRAFVAPPYVPRFPPHASTATARSVVPASAAPGELERIVHGTAVCAERTAFRAVRLADRVPGRGGSRSAVGATGFNSVHVKNYVSCDQGLTKTVETLHLKAYGDIRSALASGSRDRRQGRSAPDPLIHDRP